MVFLTNDITISMRKYFGFLLLSILLISCGGQRGSVSVEGRFKNLQDGRFFVFSTDPSWGTFDTIRITDGSFSFTHELYDTVLLTVQYPNFLQMPIVAIPGKTIKIKGDASNLLATRISGSKENEELSDFRRSIIKKTPAEINALGEEFIRNNPSSYASMAILEKYFLANPKPNYAQLDTLFNIMMKTAPKRASLQLLYQRSRGLIKCRVGAPLPSFNAVTIDSIKISQATLKDKYSLITLWATWNGDIYASLRLQRQELRPFLKKINIVNISLDADTIETKRFIREDSIPGYHICDRMSWQSPLVQSFGVRNLPSTILVDKQGRILARDLELDAIKGKLQELLETDK